VQAVREIVAKDAQIQSYPQRMQVELDRNDDLNSKLLIQGVEIGAIDAAFEIAKLVTISSCACGTSSGTEVIIDSGAAARAIQVSLRSVLQAVHSVEINSINSRALIKNLLIEQAVAIQGLPSIQLNADIAGAELRRQLNKTKRLVEDHAFFQDITNDLWYRDPSLAFKLEEAEEEYQDLMQEYRIELYKLARMIEAAWTERFQNPVKDASGSVNNGTLNNGSFDGFTEAESVFGVANHVQGQEFSKALKAWDLKLRQSPYRGSYSPALKDANFFTGQPISLRRDIFKLIDYRYNFEDNIYETDEALQRQSIQKFRAILMDLAIRDPVNNGSVSPATRLRIDFPLIYNQTRVILGQENSVPIVQQQLSGANQIDVFWNHRVKEIGMKIAGKNVFAAGNTVEVRLDLYGNVDRIGFFPDSAFTSSRTISSFPVPLYQRDPDQLAERAPFFGEQSLTVAIGSTPVEMIPVTNAWPLFCDNIVLEISGKGSLRIENLDDIELHIQMEVGSPPPINSSIW
jgi:hypothetical protein